MGIPALPPPELTTWLRDNVVPLETVEPGNGFHDLKAIGEMIGDARVVTVCEASHGIREIFQLKHRLFEYLVSERGFTTFVVTASYADSFSLWKYVRAAQNDASMALSEMRWWTLDSEEVIDLVRWMRVYNEGRSADKQISFYGCDVNAPASAVHRVVEYLEKVDRRLAREFVGLLAPITTDFEALRFHLLDEASQAGVAKTIDDLLAEFSSSDQEWTQRTSALEFGRARLAALTLLQRMESLRNPARGWQVKDRSTAENIARIMELEGSDSKVMVWTHNGHGQRTPFMSGITSMGESLDTVFGTDHVIIGTAFGEGSLQGIDPATGVLRDFTVPLAPDGTLDRMLAEIEHHIYAVDFRALPSNGPASHWLASRPGSRFTGGDFSDDPIALAEIYRTSYGLDSEYAPTNPKVSFDIMVFMRSVNVARSNWPVSPAGPTAAIQNAPQNLDFSALDDHGLPGGWTYQAPRVPGRHEITVDKGKLTIARSETPWRWGDGVVSQRFDAMEFAGRLVRLSADVENEASGVGNTAQLSIQADGESGPINAAIAEAHGSESVVEMDVPADATVLEIALLLSGNGRAAFKNVSFK